MAIGRFTAKRPTLPELPVVELPLVPESPATSILPEAVPESPPPEAPAANTLRSDKLLDAKVRLHRKLIDEINLSALDKLPEEEIRGHVTQAGVAICAGRTAGA